MNVYVNKFDQFAKHKLKAKYYIRYADDFVFLSEDKSWLERQIPAVDKFLQEELRLELHSNKVFIKTLVAGVDFLGMVSFPNHRILRTKTKRRIIKRLKSKKLDLENEIISKESFGQSLQSYLGILKHCDGYSVKREI